MIIVLFLCVVKKIVLVAERERERERERSSLLSSPSINLLASGWRASVRGVAKKGGYTTLGTFETARSLFYATPENALREREGEQTEQPQPERKPPPSFLAELASAVRQVEIAHSRNEFILLLLIRSIPSFIPSIIIMMISSWNV